MKRNQENQKLIIYLKKMNRIDNQTIKKYEKQKTRKKNHIPCKRHLKLIS